MCDGVLMNLCMPCILRIRPILLIRLLMYWSMLVSNIKVLLGVSNFGMIVLTGHKKRSYHFNYIFVIVNLVYWRQTLVFEMRIISFFFANDP